MKVIVAIICLLFSISSYSQFSIETNYNHVHIGRNMSLLGVYEFKKFKFSTGVKFHINPTDHSMEGHIYKKSFRANNLAESLGYEFNIHYPIIELSKIKLGVFYNFQFTRANVRIVRYFPVVPLTPTPSSEYDFVQYKSSNLVGPINSFENVIGVDLTGNISSSIYIYQKFGLGLNAYFNQDENAFLVGNGKVNKTTEFTRFFSIGIGYRL